ncbi:MAG: MATE family efflux transporter [Candidatus Omnitrophota bacterium]
MRNFTTGNIPKHLASFSLPILLADFFQSIYIVVDAVWVGRLLGYEALASISISFPIVFFLFSVIIGLGVGSNILVGQSYGADNTSLLSKVLVNSFIAIIAISVLLTIVGIVISKPLLGLINTPEALKAGAHVYLIIMLAGLVIRALYIRKNHGVYTAIYA